jgi:hypothetical protein
MLSLLTRSTKTQQPPAAPAPAKDAEERRRIRLAIADEQAREADRSARLVAQFAPAREREERARQELIAASEARAALEAAQLVESAGSERRIVSLRQRLAAGAPPELQALEGEIAVLIDHARTKAETRIGRGFENLDGRRSELASSNADAVTALTTAGRLAIEQLRAEALAEEPNVERFGPFARVDIPAARFAPAARHDEAGTFVARALIVPATLAAAYDAIGGVANPRPELSPGELRETTWAAERAAQRRWNSGEAWR